MRPQLSLLLALAAAPLCGRAAPVTFTAFGCGPYTAPDEGAAKFYLQLENKEKGSVFQVHLGDITHWLPPKGAEPAGGGKKPAAKKGPGDPVPPEAEYAKVAAILTTGNSLPTYVLPGDNEWNDTNDPAAAWALWAKHFLKFEEKFKPAWKTERQLEQPANFAFVKDGVIFIGLNLPGGRIHDEAEWAKRLPADAAWVSQQLAAHAGQVRAAVVMAQANPFMLSKTEVQTKFVPFLEPFRKAADTFKKPVLFLHADGHRWLDDQPWPEKNIRRVQLDKWDTKYPSVQITVAESGDVKSLFKFERRLEKPEWKYPVPSTGAKP